MVKKYHLSKIMYNGSRASWMGRPGVLKDY